MHIVFAENAVHRSAERSQDLVVLIIGCAASFIGQQALDFKGVAVDADGLTCRILSITLRTPLFRSPPLNSNVFHVQRGAVSCGLLISAGLYGGRICGELGSRSERSMEMAELTASIFADIPGAPRIDRNRNYFIIFRLEVSGRLTPCVHTPSSVQRRPGFCPASPPAARGARPGPAAYRE